MKVCILGAGSVGVHYARAWSKVGAHVDVYDISEAAIERFSELVWPERYAEPVPHTVKLKFLDHDRFVEGKYDLAVVGTPPSSHAVLLKNILRTRAARQVSIQKPISTPRVEDIRQFLLLEQQAKSLNVNLFSGYNHRHSPAMTELIRALSAFETCRLDSVKIRVEWRESWTGILNAHPWLNGPKDSYLGYTELGGGACFEHSHGLDLGLFIWGLVGGAAPKALSMDFDWAEDGDYDRAVNIALHDSSVGVSLEVKQNVFDQDSSKRISVELGREELEASFSSRTDNFTHRDNGSPIHSIEVTKNREADFDNEIRAISLFNNSPVEMMNGHPLFFGQALNTSILGALAVAKARMQDETVEELQSLLELRLSRA